MTDWKTLSEAPEHVERIAKSACTTSAGFEGTLMLLYSVGRFYLPEAFTWLAAGMQRINAPRLLSEKSNRFVLESLLQGEVHRRMNDIRQNLRWQDAVLHLLNVLVELGSSAAFQMRERVIRPGRPAM